MKTRETLTATNADKYVLYGKAVQTPRDDARFLARYFQRITGRSLRVLREDFCGTANILTEFVKLHKDNRGIGIDLDPEPLAWCRQHNVAALTPEQRSRIMLLQQNVILTQRPKADMVAAFNFSYCVMKTRKELLVYFKAARRSLAGGGVFVVDNHGGNEVPLVGSETWRCGKFKYTWEVVDFDPMSHHILYQIHFVFPDGSRIKDAFVYHWRLWTLPELQELFVEAGFRNVQVLWECTHGPSGFGNGVMRRVTRGRLEGAWYAMVTGQA
jgi:SAM-dependent methyltransferase